MQLRIVRYAPMTEVTTPNASRTMPNAKVATAHTELTVDRACSRLLARYIAVGNRRKKEHAATAPISEYTLPRLVTYSSPISATPNG